MKPLILLVALCVSVVCALNDHSVIQEAKVIPSPFVAWSTEKIFTSQSVDDRIATSTLLSTFAKLAGFQTADACDNVILNSPCDLPLDSVLIILVPHLSTSEVRAQAQSLQNVDRLVRSGTSWVQASDVTVSAEFSALLDAWSSALGDSLTTLSSDASVSELQQTMLQRQQQASAVGRRAVFVLRSRTLTEAASVLEGVARSAGGGRKAVVLTAGSAALRSVAVGVHLRDVAAVRPLPLLKRSPAAAALGDSPLPHTVPCPDGSGTCYTAYFTADIVSGLFIGLLMLFFGAIGAGCLFAMPSPDRFEGQQQQRVSQIVKRPM